MRFVGVGWWVGWRGGVGCISAEIDYGVSENMNDIAGLTEYIVRAKRTDEYEM